MTTARFTSKLANKKVLIIGGSAGVGLSVATAILEFGGIAIISSSSSSRVASAISSLKSSVPDAADRVYGTTIDLSTNDQLDERIIQLLDFAKSAHNDAALDHIVFTAGDVVPFAKVQDATPEIIQKLLQVRIYGSIFVAKHAPKYLAPGPHSSITLTTGNSKDKPAPGWALVAGLVGTSQEGLVRGLATELAPVRTNLVSLGVTETELLGQIGITGEILGRLVQGTLLKRAASADDVAEAYLYLMRDANVTGQTITTDGGYGLV